MKKIGIILILLSFLFLNACSTQKPTEQIDKNIKISSIRVAYAYADNYAKRNLGDKYELYRIEGNHDKDFNGEIKFIYTKRVEHFPDGYFVIVDTVNNEIRYMCQTNAHRLYGEDQYVNIENWKFNIEIALEAASELGIDYDEIRWDTVFEDRIAVSFYKNGEGIDNLIYNTFTAERITDKQVYIPDFFQNQK
ncbi:MAG: hypothetical protein IJT38_05755 [Clostridia bacterium]|nr:hypothetical protein [Clostridia bacterium]